MGDKEKALSLINDVVEEGTDGDIENTFTNMDLMYQGNYEAAVDLTLTLNEKNSDISLLTVKTALFRLQRFEEAVEIGLENLRRLGIDPESALDFDTLGSVPAYLESPHSSRQSGDVEHR